MQRLRPKSIVILAALLLLALVAVTAVTLARPNLELQASPLTTAATPKAVTPPTEGAAFIAINPKEGFPLDPFLVSLQAGGSVSASSLSAECRGFVSAAPAVQVDFGGKAESLKAFFNSDSDTTLVVQTPDGGYLCNDDTGKLLLDPTVAITNPAQGVYRIWVGNANGQGLVAGFLILSTHADVNAGAVALANLVRRPPMPAILPLRQRTIDAAERMQAAVAGVKSAVALKAGGKPASKAITAAGDLPVPELQTGDALCSGLVSLTPDYAFDWTGDTDVLNLYVEADRDTTLFIRAPDGSTLCADDADPSNRNPLLAISQPAKGRYLVWVGRIDPNRPATGALTITEDAEAQPQALSQP